MLILKYVADLGDYLKKINTEKSSIGFVPTMGALHNGHISLLQKCKQDCDITICSIFINPTQFNSAEDFKKYPSTPQQDIYLLEKYNCDILFTPEVDEIYPEGISSGKHFDLGYLETILEGKYRPGHFQGVCNVVKRLLDIVQPSHLFLGQKDYQQCLVIKKLLALMNANTELVICPTTREENGLAMSSRNMRLNDEQKQQASEICKTLLFIKEKFRYADLNILKDEAIRYLSTKNFKVDYAEIACANNLKVINEWDGKENLVALVAAFIGEVRLIDNMILTD